MASLEIELRSHMASLVKQLKQLEEENATLRNALKEVDHMLLEQTRSQALQDFVRDMNHDIMTPLSSIKASIYLLSKLDDVSKIKKYVEVLEVQILHLQELLENLMQMNRLDMGLTDFKIQQVSSTELVQEILLQLSSQIEKKEINLIQDYGTGIPYILADKVKLGQALMNIGQNAINYTPNYGTIWVSTRHTEHNVVIEIQDSGIGIDEEDLPYIFNRFFRGDRARNTVQGSSGLGLAICKRIINFLKGSIVVNSKVGEGTCFTIMLPHMDRVSPSKTPPNGSRR